jgi:putative IMPACT (imprinted ancient) family translation regulator
MKIGERREASLTVERSRFHALVFPAESIEQAAHVVADRRREHRKAAHHCWACRIIDPDGQLVEQARDDGEVGHPGRALLEILRLRQLEGGVVVSRIFGGVKLGPGGVSRAFRAAAERALLPRQTDD